MSLPETIFEVAPGRYSTIEYGVTPDHYRQGTPPSWEDPGDGPEIDLPNHVAIYANGVLVGHTTWWVFIADLMAAVGLTLDETEDYVYRAVLTRTEDWDNYP